MDFIIRVCVILVYLKHIQFKGIVHPKMKINPWFTYLQASLSVYDFFFQRNTPELYKKNVLALPSFIMAVMEVENLMQNKVHPSIHHKKVLHVAPEG